LNIFLAVQKSQVSNKFTSIKLCVIFYYASRVAIGRVWQHLGA